MEITRDQFLRDLGESVNRTILNHRRRFEERRARQAAPPNEGNHAAFRISRNPEDAKERWVNGTPEYSLDIEALRQLFPEARFIHLVRAVDLVVRSMLNFDRVGGSRLVETPEEGYQRWMRIVQSCLTAEKAFGPQRVLRLSHSDLIVAPERAMRRVLEFLGEPFARACLEPLGKRINSSGDQPPPSPEGEVPSVVQEARRLWELIKTVPQPEEPDPAKELEMEAMFNERVAYFHGLDQHFGAAQQAYRQLEHEFRERTQWAFGLKVEGEEKDRRIRQLEEKLAERKK